MEKEIRDLSTAVSALAEQVGRLERAITANVDRIAHEVQAKDAAEESQELRKEIEAVRAKLTRTRDRVVFMIDQKRKKSPGVQIAESTLSVPEEIEKALRELELISTKEQLEGFIREWGE